jgi:hypothetical protein
MIIRSARRCWIVFEWRRISSPGSITKPRKRNNPLREGNYYLSIGSVPGGLGLTPYRLFSILTSEKRMGHDPDCIPVQPLSVKGFSCLGEKG